MMEPELVITISDVLEHQYCPRFIYYMYVLDIPQHEETRKKVIKGRKTHEFKSKTNIRYLRKKLGVIRKEINIYLYSEKYQIRGILDEILFLNDGTIAPFEYKYAEYKKKVFKTYKFQLVIQGLLIKEKYCLEVKKGFLCYIRSKNQIKEIQITEKDFNKAIEVIHDIIDIMKTGSYPKRTSYRSRCSDCCYRNICA